MPIDYVRDDNARTIVLIARGDASIDDWRAAIRRQIAEGCWGYGLLYDAGARTNDTSLEEAEQAIQEVSVLIRRHGPRGPVAFVVKNLAEYDLGRTYASLAERLAFAYETFADAEDARQWLSERLRSQPSPS